MNAKEYLRAGEVAERLSLPVSTVYALAKRGVLPSVKVGRAVRFPAAGLAVYLDGATTGAASPPPLDLPAKR